jgi:hypothetical protein
MKHHFPKQDDCISKGSKQKNTSSFLFFVNKFLSFFVPKVSTNLNFIEKLQRQSKEKL